jgi:hypothetical protein
MEGGWLIDLAEERILGEEAPELGIEVAGLGVVEAGLGVEVVACEGEAVGAGGQLVGEAEVAPGILGPDSGPQDRHFTAETSLGLGGAGFAGGGAPLRFPMSPRTRAGFLRWRDSISNRGCERSVQRLGLM